MDIPKSFHSKEVDGYLLSERFPVSEDYGVPPEEVCEWDGCETVSVDEYVAVGDSYERRPYGSLDIKSLLREDMEMFTKNIERIRKEVFKPLVK